MHGVVDGNQIFHIVTDAAVRHLPKTMQVVGLLKTKVTPACVSMLVALPLLREVDLRQNKLTAEEVEPLRRRGVVVKLR